MKLRPLSALALASVAVCSSAADPSSTSGPASARNEPRPKIAAYRPAVDRILATSLSSGQAYAKLEQLVRVAPHRLSGSPGAAAAIEWARQAMIADGLENVRLEPCEVTHWERGEVERLRVTAPPALAGTDLSILALGGSVGTPEKGVTARVVEVRTFEELEALGDAAQGRIVFFNRPMDAAKMSTFEAYGGAVSQRSQGPIRAARAGGVAAVVRSMTTRLDDFPHTGATRYADDVEQVPAVAVSTLGAELLSRLLAEDPDLELTLQLDCRTIGQAPSFNVVGELVGRELPEEVVVLGGHLDAWDVGQGAHDDGGPCCQTIEAVRLIKSLDLRPRRTLRVVLWMNEENGLGGARAYHARYEDELDRHVLALESDSGAFTPRGFRTDANPEARAILEEIAWMFAPAGGDRIQTASSGGADVSVLSRDGVVTAGFMPDPHRYFDLHHSARDTIAEVSPREIELGAGLIAALCYVVADLETALPGDEPR